jgi:hypothetical protein
MVALADGGTVSIGSLYSTPWQEAGLGPTTFGAGTGAEMSFPLATYGWGSYVAKHDSAGGLVWARSVEGVSLGGVAALPDGSVFIAGSITLYSEGQDWDAPTEMHVWNDETADDGIALSVVAAGETNSLGLFTARLDPEGTATSAAITESGDACYADAACAWSDGSYAVYGQLSGSATFGSGEEAVTLSSANAPFVARYHADGTLDWARVLANEPTSTRRARSTTAMAALADGSLLAAGSFRGTVEFAASGNSLTSSSDDGVFVARLDATGDLDWVCHAAEGGTADALAAGADGSFAITGKNGNSMTFAPGTGEEASLGTPGFFVARYDAEGALAWANGTTNPSENGDSDGIDVSLFADGSCVVVGSLLLTATFGDFTLETPDYYALGNEPDDRIGGFSDPQTSSGFAVRYLADGTAAWATLLGDGTRCWGVAAFPDGTFAVTGNFIRSSTFGEGDAQETDLTSGTFDVVSYGPFNTILQEDVYHSTNAFFSRWRAFAPTQDLVSSANPVADVEVATPSGGTTAIEVDFSDATLGSGGVVAVEAAAEGPEVPSGYKLGDAPVWYDITSTASYEGTITLRFTWNEGDFANESNLALFHYEDGEWTDITTSVDTENNVITGETTSLSPFVLAEVSYTYGGIESPVDAGGASVFKAGKTIPLKFRIYAPDGSEVTDAAATLRLWYLTSSVLGTEVTDVGSVGSANTGNEFRYDTEAGRYVFNLGTKHLLSGTYRADVELDDGSTHPVQFSLR